MHVRSNRKRRSGVSHACRTFRDVSGGYDRLSQGKLPVVLVFHPTSALTISHKSEYGPEPSRPWSGVGHLK